MTMRIRAQDLRSVGRPNVEMVEPVWTPPVGVPPTQWPAPSEIAEPLVCAICGVVAPAESSSHHAVPSWSRFVYPAGRFCFTCTAANRGARPVGVVAGLVDLGDPAAAAVLRAVRRFHDLGDWTNPWLPGYAERWAFVDRDAVAEVIEGAHRSMAPKPNRAGRGCGGCGMAEATSWHGDVLTRTSEHRLLCPGCYALLECAGGMGERFEDALAARAAGLTGPPMVRFAERIGFRSHAMRCPDDSGSRAPFEWLGSDLARLREWAAERWPALVAGADAVQVQAAQRAGLMARLDQGSAQSSLTLDGRM